MQLRDYFKRIGWSGAITPTLESLGALLQAHNHNVPFENLDVQLGNPLIVNVTPPHYLKNHNEGGLEKLLDAHSSLADAILRDIKSTDEMREDSIVWTKIMVDEGMLVGLGTDVPYGGMWSGDALHREMEIWVNESKVSPLRTIQAATYDNARIMKWDDRTGSIQEGKEADLLVVKGNPAENISDTRNIEYVFTNGKLVDRESLTRQWKP